MRFYDVIRLMNLHASFLGREKAFPFLRPRPSLLLQLCLPATRKCYSMPRRIVVFVSSVTVRLLAMLRSELPRVLNFLFTFLCLLPVARTWKENALLVMSCITSRALLPTCLLRDLPFSASLFIWFLRFPVSWAGTWRGKSFSTFDCMGEVLVCGSLMQLDGEAVFEMFCVTLWPTPWLHSGWHCCILGGRMTCAMGTEG